MTDSEFTEFIQSSGEILKKRQDALWTRFRIAEWEQFDWYQAAAEIVFSHAGIPKVIASIQFVGSYSRLSSTWLWSWANPSVDSRLKVEILEVKEFGEANGIARLTNPKWETDEIAGWEMTSVAANVLKADGAYRSEGESRFTYMLLKNVRWVEGVAA